MSHAIKSQFFGPLPLGLIHVINHNQNTLEPDVAIIEAGTNEVIVPAKVIVNSANQLTIILSAARSIRVRVI